MAFKTMPSVHQYGQKIFEGAVYIVYGPVSGVMSLGDAAARWWGDFANARTGPPCRPVVT